MVDRRRSTDKEQLPDDTGSVEKPRPERSADLPWETTPPAFPLWLSLASGFLMFLAFTVCREVVSVGWYPLWIMSLVVSLGLSLGLSLRAGAAPPRENGSQALKLHEAAWLAHGLLWGVGSAGLLPYHDLVDSQPLIFGMWLLAILAIRELYWPPWRLFGFQVLLLLPSPMVLLLVLLGVLEAEVYHVVLQPEVGLEMVLQLACLAILIPDRQGRVLNFPARLRLAAQAAEYLRLQFQRQHALQQVVHYTELSQQDSLTRLANRRFFDDFLGREWRRACRTGRPLSLILLDVDHFKRYNDHYGHPAGDACLRAVAGLLQSYGRRGGDLVARYGGEEFAVVLAETDLVEARSIAEQIRVAMPSLRVWLTASKSGPVVSASLGVACVRAVREQSPEFLVQLADKALYQAKRSGRNRVETYDPNAAAGDSSTAADQTNGNPGDNLGGNT